MLETPSSLGRILLAEDEEALRAAMARALSAAGLTVTQAEDGLDAQRKLDQGPYDAVVTDISMPGADGIALFRAVRERDPDVPVILVTGVPALATAIEALELGAVAYLVKPVELAKLKSMVQRSVLLGRMAREKRRIASVELIPHAPPVSTEGSLSRSFRLALDGLWTAFQPIVRADGSIFGYEALLRSNEPTLPDPGAVLAAAEQLGRLDELGRRVRALVAEPLGTGPDEALFFVNVHPRDLYDDTIIAENAPLRRMAHRIVLEMTERASLGDVEQVRERIALLRAQGYRVAVDDLGAGYAGLTWIAMLEPDVVKLDMSLVRGVDTNVTKQKLVRSMASACRELGMHVVAEGVETRAEFATLVELGCDLLQGFLFAHPGPAFPRTEFPLEGARP